jgi:hypothetical protein
MWHLENYFLELLRLMNADHAPPLTFVRPEYFAIRLSRTSCIPPPFKNLHLTPSPPPPLRTVNAE